jgi:ABC-type branched-subunit amino acid transport system substrate-binding protein
VQLYSGMKDSVLAMQQTIGSPINTALAPEYEADTIVNFPSAWSKTLTEIPGTGVVGATYDVEIANGYDYLFQEGLLKEGDTVGHIYFEGEYGANGLAGSQAVAKEKGLKIIEAQIKSTDQDMSAQVTQFKAAGVKAIALTVAPGQTASVAAVAEAQGLDVPILGNNPVFAPGLLAGPTAAWLKSHLYVASPVSAFDAHPDLLKSYQEAYPDVTPSLGVVVGTGMAVLMKQVLDAACENGDLTRAGVLEAFEGLKDIDTEGLVVPIRGFEKGKSPSLESFVLQPADVPGGAKNLEEATQGEFAESIAG